MECEARRTSSRSGGRAPVAAPASWVRVAVAVAAAARTGPPLASPPA